jgi:hypothetical protein
MKKNLFIIYTLSFITFLNSSTYRNCSSVEELRKMSDILKDQKPCFDITALLEKGFVTIKDFFDTHQEYNAFTIVSYKGISMTIYKALTKRDPEWIALRTKLIPPRQ